MDFSDLDVLQSSSSLIFKVCKFVRVTCHYSTLFLLFEVLSGHQVFAHDYLNTPYEYMNFYSTVFTPCSCVYEQPLEYLLPTVCMRSATYIYSVYCVCYNIYSCMCTWGLRKVAARLHPPCSFNLTVWCVLHSLPACVSTIGAPGWETWPYVWCVKRKKNILSTMYG